MLAPDRQVDVAREDRDEQPRGGPPADPPGAGRGEQRGDGELDEPRADRPRPRRAEERRDERVEDLRAEQVEQPSPAEARRQRGGGPVPADRLGKARRGYSLPSICRAMTTRWICWVPS
jgi:hypothetical protein